MLNTYQTMCSDKISDKTFKKKIKELRKELKLSQDQFAEKAKVSLPTVQNWEYGTLPKVEMLIRICNTFGVDMDYFTGRIDAHNRDTNFVMEYTGLSEESVLKLREMKRKHPSALNVLDALLQLDSEQIDGSGRLSAINGMFFLNLIAYYFLDRQAIELLRGYLNGDCIAYSIKDSAAVPDQKQFKKTVVNQLADLNERNDLKEFQISKDIFGILERAYERFKENDCISGVPIDKYGSSKDRYIEIRKNSAP